MTRFILSISLLTLQLQILAQGAKPITKEQYESIQKSMVTSGASEIDESYLLPQSQFPTPGDQGKYLNCVGWAVGYALHSYYQGKVNFADPLSKDHTLSFSYIYDRIKGRFCQDCKCEVGIYDALKYLQGKGNVPLSAYPDPCKTVDTTKLQPIESKYKIKGFTPVPLENLNNIKLSIYNDVPVIACIGYDKDFWEWRKKGKNDVFQTSRDHEQWRNHAVLITGYDDKKKAFRIINSWGLDWGHEGYAWIGYTSFRIMANLPTNNGTLLNPGFVINKDFGQVTAGGASINDSNISSANFHPYVFKERISSDEYSFTTGFTIDEHVVPLVQRIDYNYDHPTFINKKSTSYKKPNFENSYVGWGCLSKMTATVYLLDGSTIELMFNACEALKSPIKTRNLDVNVNDISASVTADYISKNKYNFKIRLKGIEGLKEDITKVVYHFNHPTFKNPVVTTSLKSNNFETSYKGWGCLTELEISIHFTDGTIKNLSYDMCNALGWE